MSKITIQNQIFIYVSPFEAMGIMTIFTNMNVKKFKLKIHLSQLYVLVFI
jgi:hypothetical protein